MRLPEADIIGVPDERRLLAHVSFKLVDTDEAVHEAARRALKRAL